jgi:hypothetical protein
MIGCGCLVVLVALVGVGLLLVPKGVWNMVGDLQKAIAEARAERDRLFAEALADGDAAAAHGRADEWFRREYTAEQLAAYFRDQPALFDPPKNSVGMSSGTINGRTVVSTTFETQGRRYAIYASKDDGGLHLLGISPSLDRAVPAENRPSEESGKKAIPAGPTPKAKS